MVTYLSMACDPDRQKFKIIPIIMNNYLGYQGDLTAILRCSMVSTANA